MKTRNVKNFFLFLIPALALAQQVPPASWQALKYPPLREIQIPKVQETTLPNGMKVYLLENHELPLVRGTALVRTGNLFDPADKVGLATVTGEAIRAAAPPPKAAIRSMSSSKTSQPPSKAASMRASAASPSPPSRNAPTKSWPSSTMS